MTNAELLALLREARERLEANQDPLGLADDNQIAINGFRTAELIDRIDAAIDAQSQPEEECQPCEFCKGRGTVPAKKAWSPESVLRRLDDEG